MKKFLIIDGNSIMNRAFYGVATSKMLATKEGIYTNAVYGFLNIYWMILDKISADYVAVCFDLKAPTFRHQMFEDYKATRKSMPDELRMQMPYIKQILTAMTIPIFELEGYEADDILGTVASRNEKDNIFTYILTGDKDSFQLVSENTSIIIPTSKMGKTEYTTYDPATLKEKYTITPEQVIHVKALMGDSSDNIPGVKGIGEKTAYSLINEYSTIDNIYENIDTIQITDKVREKLASDKEMAFKSKELATINREVPIELDYSKCILSEPKLEELYTLFKKLEFNKFMNKYDFSMINSESPSKKDDTNNLISDKFNKTCNMIYINKNNIQTLVNIFNLEKVSYYTNLSNHIDKKSINLSKKVLAIYDEISDNIYVLDIDEYEDYHSVLRDFATSKSLKLGYNLKSDLLYIFNNVSEEISGFNYDLLIAYYLMDSNRTSYDINYIFTDLFNITIPDNNNNSQDKQICLFNDESMCDNKLSENEEKILSMYLKGINFSYNLVMEKLKALGMLDLFHTIEMPLTETLAYMEHTGMYIDVKKLNEFNNEIVTNISNLESEIYNLAGETFNINSTQQLGNILFNKLNLPTIRKTKTGFSTDKEVLEELAPYHNIIEKVLEYRQIVKLKTTYVDGLKTRISEDGRVHTTFMQTVASTGRLSSVEPNLQNIPVRLELGKKIRSFFIGQNENVIVDADYSQIELRVLADISNDATMIRAFNNNEDIHTVTASQVFDTEIENVTKELRSKAKAVNFGIVYGISDYGLAKNVGTTRKEANIYIENYLSKYSGIKEFMTSIVETAKKYGYVSTLFNRRRYIPEINQKNKNIVQFGERVAMNTPIQGTAADIIKLAMNKIYIKLKSRKLKSKLIMQVHDELIVEATPDEIDQVKEIVKDSMENVIKLKVPLDIDLNVGKSWYDTK
ncbi:MAG: DNA polymerase I [Clostridia bacterium]|nr:DNA polymerase I [Clostridia bacterium]